MTLLGLNPGQLGPDSAETDGLPPQKSHRLGTQTARYEEGGYYDRANPYLEGLLEPGHQRVLDVGCGAGALGSRWKAARPDCEVWGIEGNEHAAAAASARLDRVLQLDLDGLDALPGDAGRFDLVALGDVLEHVRDPGRLLRTLIRSLTPAGEIVVSVPNVAHWSVLTQLLVGRFTYADEGLLDRTHIHLFTPSSSREMLVEVGLSTVTYEERVSLPSPISSALAQMGVALAGASVRQAELHLDFDTYQTVYRARPRFDGPLTGLVVCTEERRGAYAPRVIASYLEGFRAGEAVRLVVAAPSSAGRAQAVTGLVAEAVSALRTTTSAAIQPDVVAVSYDTTRPLFDQLPDGLERYIAVGAAARRALPGMTYARGDRISLLQALRAA